MFHALMTLYFLEAVVNDWQKYQWECLLIGCFGTEVSSEFGVEAQTFPKPLGYSICQCMASIVPSSKVDSSLQGLLLFSLSLFLSLKKLFQELG